MERIYIIYLNSSFLLYVLKYTNESSRGKVV